MCLITEQKEPFIAQKDIEIRKLCKVVNGEIYNYFSSWFFKYELNTLYKTDMVANNIPENSFDSEVRIAYNLTHKSFEEEASKLTNIHEGFHSVLKDYESRNWLFKRTYAEGIVPKNSLYYLDKTGLIVSNQIILTKIIWHLDNARLFN